MNRYHDQHVTLSYAPQLSLKSSVFQTVSSDLVQESSESLTVFEFEVSLEVSALSARSNVSHNRSNLYRSGPKPNKDCSSSNTVISQLINPIWELITDNETHQEISTHHETISLRSFNYSTPTKPDRNNHINWRASSTLPSISQSQNN